jgi:hypothetical protein
MTRTTHSRFALVIGAVLLATAAMRAQAQDAQAAQHSDEARRAQEELDRTPTKCVLVSRISKNVAASNSQVVFYIKGGTQYINVLDTACQVLTKGETRLIFQYENRSAKLSRLCDTDGFTVEKQTSRIGCALGAFIPITAEEAAALTAKPAAAPAANSSGGNQQGESSSPEKEN